MSAYRPLLCIVDDDGDNSQALFDFLSSQSFRVVTFSSAEEFLNHKSAFGSYDLLISDINMPGLSGFDLCRAVRSMQDPVRLPIILITGSDPLDRAQGIDAGADEFIAKPFETRHLISKISSLLEIRSRESKRLEELESSKDLNAEFGRFLSPNIANRLSGHNQDFLKPHRAEVTVLFVDLRGFTAFSEKAEPEEVLEVLRQYYTAVGSAAMRHKGTLGHLAGDGIMVFFNDPEPIENHGEVALSMALEAREALNVQKKLWQERRYQIDFGIGLSGGFATIGGIGFDRFAQYSVIGTVANFASRLCHVAVDGQILVSHRFLARLHSGVCQAAPVGETLLKGIETPVSIYNVLALEKKHSKAA